MANASDTPARPGFLGWLDHRLPVVSFLDKELNKYPTPKNLNMWWNFGSLAGIMLVVMIATGLFLAMHYTGDTKLAFNSVERIMRDVNGGWIIRYVHMNGASMFFAIVYIHIFRGLYYGSYKAPREVLWILGVVILLLMMATAFMGYVLPWGQMSLWGATVITNLFSAIPLIGETLTTWLWGGFSVDNPTLTRFFALHFLMPFLIVGVVILHLVALHMHGSNNPTGIDLKKKEEKIPFHPYYTIKDMLGLGIFFLIYGAFVFYAPNYLGHPDNYTPANPLVTPPHIVPEWYFLPFYAILRAVTFKTPLVALGLALGAFVGLRCLLKKPLLTSYVATLIALIVGIVAYMVATRYSISVEGKGIVATLLAPLTWFVEPKLGGVLAMFGAVGALFVLPWLDTHPIRSADYRPLYRKAFWLLFVVCIVLGFVGSKNPDISLHQAFILTLKSVNLDGALGFLEHIKVIYVAQAATAWYFLHFLVVCPLLSRHEKRAVLPDSLDEVQRVRHPRYVAA